MKKIFLPALIFISHFAGAQVVCRSPDAQGNEGTVAANIKKECNTHSTDSSHASNRDVNVQRVVEVVTADSAQGTDPAPPSRRGGGGDSGATR